MQSSLIVAPRPEYIIADRNFEALPSWLLSESGHFDNEKFVSRISIVEKSAI